MDFCINGQEEMVAKKGRKRKNIHDETNWRRREGPLGRNVILLLLLFGNERDIIG
jgi:hypothetical protein